ncbi:Protein of unknown function [Paenibacillus sophorae]|uniref:DUF2975 domain-containing protein n=1 Tax=Paenibacillus sophorae TaxID=1333845 RepID=A0A1H8F6A5_9BACL|nr:DUF2975 domain-containing protein [Paenibacillus sophorae]QWU13782.1 DUF2975 domain-containing protein [Paenibacillus sophorae]SEN27343.1 Protein of unknown function [Paenibacillus sophorae]
MKRGSTFFLKGVVVLIGITALALCIFWLPGIASRDAEANPETAYLQYPFLVCAYVLSIPFFVALYQAFKLLSYIDRNKAFSELSVRALRYIKYCAITISILIVSGIIFVVFFIEGDVAGVIALGLMCSFASSVIATFAAIIQKLLKDAIDIKSENDLTV